MAQPQEADAALARLRQLLDSGAITPEDFQRLTRAVQVAPPNRPGTPSATSRFFQNAGAIGAGVFAGSMAADFLTNALSDPPPEVFEYTSVTETTFTADGYITETVETLGPSGDPSGDGGASDGSDNGYAESDQSADMGGFEDFGGLEA